MGVRDESGERDVRAIRLPRWGRVVEAADHVVAWQVVDPDGRVVGPIAQFLRDFVAQGNRAGSVRSYAYALLRWWRWLDAVQVSWDRATSVEVRDFVLWLGQAEKPRRIPRTGSAATAGTMNPVTGKRHLGDEYETRTVRHSNAVLRSFYEYWLEIGAGPLVNPVALKRGPGRPHAHHNPLEPFRPEGRLRYNPKLPKARPRAIPDHRWDELFAALRSDRDRAIVAMAVSSGARAGELLGLRAADVDWGEQRVRVLRKGSRAAQWLPVSGESLVWLRLYLTRLGGRLDGDDPLWWTVRRRGPAPRGAGGDAAAGPPTGEPAGRVLRAARFRPLTYDALRAVLRRTNATLGSNYSMHDLRHTAAIRMIRDDGLSLRDVQTILGHVHASTTADSYLIPDEDEVLARVHEHLQDRTRAAAAPPPPPPTASGYAPSDLAVLLGEDRLGQGAR
ncbi:MAG: tyrosine-type recombinase/integrase [Pseudonocardia sp.]|nr:tyrosine-type recombinase/integrase [Pseudonocardia sp.]